MTDDRPDPDALLAHVNAAEPSQRSRGRLKIFFGAAPGVGKTYAMLEAARKAASEGVDLMIGYVEPHVRTDTQALVLGLDLLPRRKIEYRGTTLVDFDLEGALARHPKLVVVDELAHTNAPGSTHSKRWQDVEQLLEAGIDVSTTLNVQHLESLNDVVAKITGVVVRETVPDSVFDRADEVELVDIAPDDLIERLREGKVYVPGQAARAIDNFFQKGNLFALRELALRRTAERVGAQVRGYRQAHAISGTWPTHERLLVCVTPSPSSGRLVRAARRMAGSLHATWTVVTVEMPASAGGDAPARERLQRHLRLAERLGAQTQALSGVNVVDELLHYARRNNVTKILVGKPRGSRLGDLLRGSFVYQLTRKCGDIDVYVISGEEDEAWAPPRGPAARGAGPVAYWAAVLVVAACTGVGWLLSERFAAVNVAMIYLLGVVAVALRFGQGPSVLAAVLGVAAFNFFLVPPRLTMAVADSQYLFTFAVMLVTGLIISTLTGRVRVQADLARRREERTAALYSLSRALSGLPLVDDVARAVVRDTGAACEAEACVLLPDPGLGLAARPGSGGFEPSDRDLAVARWVHDHGKAAGLGTDTLPAADGLYLPLVDAGRVVGVLGLRPRDREALGDPERLHLAEAFAGQAAVALGRVRYAEEAGRVRLEVEAERLRNTLLSSVSHDLRTPLAGIAGASSTLLESGPTLDQETQRAMLETIFDESESLNRLVGNLLEATRLESGAMAPRRDWESIEELLGVVYARLARPLRDHPITTTVPADLPLVYADGALIELVLQNLLENAAKYSPPGSPIEVAARAADGSLVVEVLDRGAGLPEGDHAALFEKFRRVERAGVRPGSGLGLAIARGVVELHGGRIVADDRAGGGAVVRFTLPLTEAPTAEVEAD